MINLNVSHATLLYVDCRCRYMVNKINDVVIAYFAFIIDQIIVKSFFINGFTENRLINLFISTIPHIFICVMRILYYIKQCLLFRILDVYCMYVYSLYFIDQWDFLLDYGSDKSEMSFCKSG